MQLVKKADKLPAVTTLISFQTSLSSVQLAYDNGRRNYTETECPYYSETMRKAWFEGVRKGKAQEALDAYLLRRDIKRELTEISDLMRDIADTIHAMRLRSKEVCHG